MTYQKVGKTLSGRYTVNSIYNEDDAELTMKAETAQVELDEYDCAALLSLVDLGSTPLEDLTEYFETLRYESRIAYAFAEHFMAIAGKLEKLVYA